MADTRRFTHTPGQWIKMAREQRGMSVRDLAKAIDVSTQVIYDWQAGKNAVSSDRAEDLARAFDLPVIEVRARLNLWAPSEEEMREYLGEPMPEAPSETWDQVIRSIIALEDLPAERRLRQISEILDVLAGRIDTSGLAVADHDRLRQGIAAQAEDLRTELDEPKESDTDQAL